jgi:hypothetical protein
MEQQISLVSGLDISTPSPARTPDYEGGFFGLESNVPSSLRGPAAGFVAELMFNPLAGQGGFPPAAPAIVVTRQFLVGAYDFVNLEGWAIVLEGTLTGGVVHCYIGNTVLSTNFAPYPNTLVIRMEFDGTGASVYFNGFAIATDPTVTYVQGPDNFGIGGTSHASYVTTYGAAAWGAVNTRIAGFRMSPFPSDAVGEVLRLPAAQDYAADIQAGDIAQGPDPIASPPAWNLFSVRRGLPRLADDDNAVWADEVSDTELVRVGSQTRASVLAAFPSYL